MKQSPAKTLRSPARWVGLPRLAGWVGVILTGSSALAGAEIFAYLDGIPGESADAEHKEWIDVESLGARVESGIEGGSGRTFVVPKVGPFVLRKFTDKSSPYLLEAALKGTAFPELQIELTGKGRIEACYRLRGIRVVGLETYSIPGQSQTFEEVSFQYDVVEWHDFQNSPDGTSEHVGSTWNLATAEGGVLGGHDAAPPLIMPISPPQVKPGDVFEVTVRFDDPGGVPENLALSVLPSEQGLVKFLGMKGEGLSRTLSLEAGQLLNGADQLKLSLTDGVRSSTRQLPIVVAGDRTAYEVYQQGFFQEQATENPDVIHPLEDPDGDEMSNVMEFFLGTNPAVFTERKDAFSMGSETTKEGTMVRIRYFKRILASGLTESFEGSRDMNKWQFLGIRTSPVLKVSQLSAPINGYAPMEATILVSKDQGDNGAEDPGYYVRLSIQGSL